MLFKDRKDAGKQLAEALNDYKDASDAIIIALPRGGVVVGYEVATVLNLPLDIVCPRKIPAPFNPELALGAVTETGEGFFSHYVEDFQVPKDYLDRMIQQETVEAQRRLNHFRNHRPQREIKGKKVILIDDGIATGSTMKAAIQTLKKEEASEMILAVPVAPPDTLKQLSTLVTKVVCLESPSLFYAVGQFYELFDQTSDEEVIELLDRALFHRKVKI